MPPTGVGKGAGADDRMCYNCWEWGHIGKDCPQPDRRKAAARSLEASSQEAPVSPSTASLKPLTLATATSRIRTHLMRTAMRLCPLWTRVGNSSQRKSGDPIESCTSKCCEPYLDEAMFNSDVETWPRDMAHLKRQLNSRSHETASHCCEQICRI